MPEPVIIVNYYPAWPSHYEEEKNHLLIAIDDYIKDIQHVGSTSVPGLGSKPIIDIMVGIRGLSLVEKCVEPMQELGYKYMGEHGIPGRHFFCKPPGESRILRTHHVHLMETHHPEWKKHQLFRDYLRTHPEDASQYYQLKKELADKFGSDREGYSEAKTSFIEGILAKAASEE